jgi:hypothetical protein
MIVVLLDSCSIVVEGIRGLGGSGEEEKAHFQLSWGSATFKSKHQFKIV